MPRPLLVGRNAGEAGSDLEGMRRHSTGAPIWTRRSQIRSTRSTSTRRPPTAARRCREAARSPRQTYLLREADCGQLGCRAGSVSTGEEGGREARRRAGQAVAARAAETENSRDTGFFGEIFSVRGEFGYWVFEGDTVPAQRPSWNYRKEDGGGMIIDMLCHWRYVLDNLFGEVKAVRALARPTSRSAGTKRGSRTSARPTTRLTRPSNSRAELSRISIPRGACACGVTIC